MEEACLSLQYGASLQRSSRVSASLQSTGAYPPSLNHYRAVEPELKFHAPAPGIWIFWPRRQNDLFH